MKPDNEFLFSLAFVLIESLLVAFFVYQSMTLLPHLGLGNKGQRRAQKWTDDNLSIHHSFGSQDHRIAIILLQAGIQTNGKEKSILWFSRIGFGVVCFIFAMILNLHWGFALALGVGIPWLATQFIIDTIWKKLVDGINDRIPGFISSLSSTLQIIPDVSGAIEEVCSIRPENDLLRHWMEDRVLRAAKSEGGLYAAYDALITEAFEISNALGVLIYILNRYDESGGGLWQNTFRMVNDNMMTYLQGVGKTKAIAASSQNQTTLIGGINLIIMIFIGQNQIGSENLLAVRLVQFGAIAMMLIGWRVIQSMVNNALE